jgi:hypothetical protein
MSGLSDRIPDSWEPEVTVGIARSDGARDFQPTDEVASLIASADMRPPPGTPPTRSLTAHCLARRCDRALVGEKGP